MTLYTKLCQVVVVVVVVVLFNVFVVVTWHPMLLLLFTEPSPTYISAWLFPWPWKPAFE